MNFKEQVAQALQGLDQLGSPEAIADHFRKEGIRGGRCQTGSCPVARYIAKKVPRLDLLCLSVYPNVVEVGFFNQIPTPINVSAFILLFDAHMFNDLHSAA